MGLDMMLYVTEKSFEDVKTIDHKNLNEVAYWRKSNMIHKWFVENVQEGDDDCGYYEVSKEKLLELIHKCENVSEKIIGLHAMLLKANGMSEEMLINNVGNFKYCYEHYPDLKLKIPESVIEFFKKELPTWDGFFFGNTDYDTEYVWDVVSSISMLEHALRLSLDGKHIYYHSSW